MYRNSDYGTSKGLEFNLHMRRTNNIELDVKYTLAYATGTGSYANTQQNIAWTNSQVPKQAAPLDYDQRHNLIGVVDYRLGRQQGPRIGDKYPLENFGINIVSQVGSGLPYSPQNLYNEVTLAAVTPTPSAARNSAYGPWTINIDLKAEKIIQLQGYKITPYLWVKNLLDRDNVTYVYEGTGRPNTTGWLATSEGQAVRSRSSRTGLYWLERRTEIQTERTEPDELLQPADVHVRRSVLVLIERKIGIRMDTRTDFMKQKLWIGVILSLLAVAALAAPPQQRGKAPKSAASLDTDTWIDANRLLMFVTNDGSFASDLGGILGKTDGLYYPFTSLADIRFKKNDNSVVYASGLWLGAKDSVTGDILITVAEYSEENVPGPMVDGEASPDDPFYYVYKIRSDSTGDNANRDYRDWPDTLGAPVDIDRKAGADW